MTGRAAYQRNLRRYWQWRWNPAELPLDEIWRLVDDLIEAQGDLLPRYH
ncbi:hypothetical protein KXR53_10115 [Inquilinus limosus]